MAGIYGQVYVDAPAAGPLRYGLFNASRGPIDMPGHGAVGGVQFEPTTCGGAHLYTAECPITNQDVKALDPNSGAVTAAPFVAYASIQCSPVGRSLDEQAQRARARLLAGEQTQVEAALWSGGGVGASPALTGIGATTVVTALTSFAARLSALEEAFYDLYGYQGTVHVNTRAYGAAAFGQLINRVDTPDIPQHLTTPLGSIWSFGAGYDITGPAGVAPSAAGNVWAFMTGPVTIWRDADIFMQDPAQTFDRTTNQLTVIAERAYALAPDCSTAVAIELPLEAP